MKADVVDVFRRKTGKTKTKKRKWEGTCFTCRHATKRGFCNVGGTWKAHVRRPDMYCESWKKQ